MTSTTLPPVPPAAFASRRSAVLERLGEGVMVLPAAAIQRASRDTERPYVPDRELYWLTGMIEPETVAVLAGGDQPGFRLFVRERDPDAELWAGPRLGPERAGELAGADECHALGELPTLLPDWLGRADRIHYRLGGGGEVERHVLGALERARARGPRAGTGPRGVVDPGEILDDMRLIKDGHELALIREACRVTVTAHRAAASVVAAGVGEWVVEAELEAAFRRLGARGPGFESIVGGGPNACVLHYVDNTARIPEDALVLVDAGAEVGLYHGDVTRTYPVGGAFSGPQRAVYEVVEAARAAAVGAVRPGATIAGVHETAVRVLLDGLVDLGVLEGSMDELVDQEAHKPLYPHQTSHWLGLDVHDPGDYARGGASRRLEPGMVFTVEPGLYFRPELELSAGAEPYRGIGVRIEDDVVVTESGCEVLTDGLPTAASDVEALVGG